MFYFLFIYFNREISDMHRLIGAKFCNAGLKFRRPSPKKLGANNRQN